MAKKRVQVADLDASVTAVRPVASVVDTYVRPPAELNAPTELESFVDAIAPFVQSKVKEEQARNEKLASQVLSGVLEKQTFQAKNAARELTKLASEDYQNNYDRYMELDRETVAKHRQSNYNTYYQQLQESGISPVVTNLIKKDMEAVDYKFFTEIFIPQKFDYDVTKTLTNDLAPQLIALAENPNDNSLAEGTKTIEVFRQLYPNIPVEKINELVEQQELRWATSTDSDGVIRGKSWRSEWLVNNKRDKVKKNLKLWATIEQAQANKELAIKQATVKRQDAFISAGVTSQTDMLTAIWKGNKPSYLADFSKWTDEVESKRNEFQQSLEKQFGKGSPLVAQGLIDYDISIQSLTTKEVLPEMIKQGRTDTLNTNMTNVLNRGLLNTTVPEEERITTGVALLDDMVVNSGLTEAEVEEEAFRQQIELTELYGTNTPFYEWLKKTGSLNKAEYTDETQKIFDELEKYNKQFAEQNLQANKTAFLTQRLAKFKTTRDSTLLSNLEYTDVETGKTVKIPEAEIQAAYEQEASNQLALQLARIDKEYNEVLDSVGDIPEGLEEDVANKRQAAKAEAVATHADRKIKDFYLPRGVLPVEVTRILNNTTVMQALTSKAGEDLDEQDINMIQQALSVFETMNDYSPNYTNVAFSSDSDTNLKMTHLSRLVRDMDMSIPKAVDAIQGRMYPVSSVTLDEDEILEATKVVDWWPDDTPFEDVMNTPDLRLYIEGVIQTEMSVFGKTKEQALPTALKYAFDDFLISEGVNGTKTAILKRNTDQQRLAANPARMKQLVTAIYDIQGFPDYMEEIAGEDADLVVMGHPTNANMAQVIITNENAERNPILNLSYNDLLTLPLETVKARILSETQDKISYSTGVTPEEKLVLQQAQALAAGMGVYVDTTSTTALAQFQKAKEAGEQKRMENEAQALRDREAYLASLPPEAAVVREDIQIPVVREALEAIGVTDFIEVTNFIQNKISPDRFDELVSEQRKLLTDRKAINRATKALRDLDPIVAKELGLEDVGLFSKKLTERGITVNEQGEIAHAVLALLQIVKENQ